MVPSVLVRVTRSRPDLELDGVIVMEAERDRDPVLSARPCCAPPSAAASRERYRPPDRPAASRVPEISSYCTPYTISFVNTVILIRYVVVKITHK